jgi:hypothetical protein
MAEQQFVIRLGVNAVGVERGVDAATKSVDKLARRIGGLFALNAIRGYIQGIVEKGGAIAAMAKQWGATAEFVQKNAFAAKQTNAEVTDLQASYKTLQKAQVDAIKGNDESTAAFMRTGLSIEQLKKLAPEELFRSVGMQLAKLPPSAQTTADAMTLMGKSGVTMLGSFRDGFFDVADGAKEAGQVIEDSVVKALDNAGDSIDALGNRMVVALAPGVAKLAEWADAAFDLVNQGIHFTAAVSDSLSRGATFDDALKDGAEVVKELAREDAEADSKVETKPQKARDASDVEEDEEKKKKTKARTAKEDASASVDSVDAQARRGVFVGGRGGEITRVPQATLEELRAQSRRQERIHEIQLRVERNGASMLDELRKLNADDRA